MSFIALSNNITSNPLPFFSSFANSSNETIYRRGMYPDTLEESVFKSILGNNKEDPNSPLRSKRAISVNSRAKQKEEEKCLRILGRISSYREIGAFQSSLKNVRCDFSNKDSEASKSAKKIYDNIQNYLDSNCEVELNRFLFLNRIIFHSEGFVSSDLVNQYLARINQITKLLWKHPPISESEKSKIKIILSKHFKYKLAEKCNRNEREALHSIWKQCMIDVLSVLPSLYSEIAECKNFAINYMNNFRDLLSITPQEKKESIGNMIWGHLQGFMIIRKNDLNVRQKNALREQLQIQNITEVTDLINQASSVTQQDESTVSTEEFTDQTHETDEDSTTAAQSTSTMEPVSSAFSAWDKITDAVTSVFTALMNQTHVIDEISTITTQSTTAEAIDQEDQTDLTNEGPTTAEQSTSTMEAHSVFSAEDEATEEETSIFATSMQQALVADEVSTITTQASIYTDESTVSPSQSTTTEGINSMSTAQTNQTYATSEVFINTTQPTPTVETSSSISSIQDKTTNTVTRSTDQSEDLSTLSTEKIPTEKVTVASTQVPIIATSVGIVSTLAAFISYIFFRKKKSENVFRAASSTKESVV